MMEGKNTERSQAGTEKLKAKDNIGEIEMEWARLSIYGSLPDANNVCKQCL